MNPEAKRATRAGVKAFTHYFVDTITYAINSGDTQPMRAVSLLRCQSCDAIAENIEKVYEAGGSIASKGWTIRKYQNLGVETASQSVIVGLGITQHPSSTQSSPSASPISATRVERSFKLYLLRRSGTWRVQQFNLLDSP